MSNKEFTPKEVAKELLDAAADVLAESLEKSEDLQKAMKAKQVIMEEGRPPLKGWKYGKRKVGSWTGPNPNGAVVDDMRSLDMKTGEVTMHGPKGELPGEDKVKTFSEIKAERSGDMDKVAPENQDAAQAQKLDVPQPDAPKAPEKLIDKKPLQLKKFMENVAMKKAGPIAPPPPPSTGTINSKIGFPFGKKESK